LIRIAK